MCVYTVLFMHGLDFAFNVIFFLLRLNHPEPSLAEMVQEEFSIVLMLLTDDQKIANINIHIAIIRCFVNCCFLTAVVLVVCLFWY